MTAISDAHRWLGRISRSFDADRINKIVNDPSIYRWVKGYALGKLDLSGVVADHDNYLLMGEHGGVLFCEIQFGMYEAHTQILPAGRGEWAVNTVRAAVHWMFANTGAVEILSKCPHRKAKALAHAVGLRPDWTVKRGWVIDNDPVPADVYAIRVQDWMRDATGLVERGRWFHERLESEYARLGKSEPLHDEEASHNRYVGAALEMMFGGQLDKAVIFYNRWAAMSEYAPVAIVSRNPVVIDIRDALIGVGNQDIRVL